MGEMKITNRKNDLGVVLQVEGRIDTYTAETFEQALLELLEKESVVTVDFEDVEYVSSAGPVSYTHLDVYKRQDRGASF